MLGMQIKQNEFCYFLAERLEGLFLMWIVVLQEGYHSMQGPKLFGLRKLVFAEHFVGLMICGTHWGILICNKA